MSEYQMITLLGLLVVIYQRKDVFIEKEDQATNREESKENI